MNLRIKRKNLSLSDDISPLYRFINARKILKLNYMNRNRNFPINNLINNNNNNSIKTKIIEKEKEIKKPVLNNHCANLLKEQLFILSHFSKKNAPNNINYDYNISLLNTFGNRNFFRKDNEKNNINLYGKLQNNNSNNFFKTAAIKNSTKRNNVIKRQKGSYDTIKLPMLNMIVRKNIV